MGMSFEEVCEMDVGERYCESTQYGNLWFIVKVAPETYFDDPYTKVEFIGEADDGGDIRFLITKGLEHYGPNICKEPEYMSLEDIKRE